MGMRISVFQPPGSNTVTLLYGIYAQMMLDRHWIVQGEVDFATWSDTAGDHRLTTVPVSAIFQVLPGRMFNPYLIAGLNYTNVATSGRGGSATLGAHAGAGFNLATPAIGMAIEGRYFVPDFRHPSRGFMVWGGGLSLGVGFVF